MSNAIILLGRAERKNLFASTSKGAVSLSYVEHNNPINAEKGKLFISNTMILLTQERN